MDIKRLIIRRLIVFLVLFSLIFSVELLFFDGKTPGGIDKFGIKEIYNTSGREWYSTWNDGHNRSWSDSSNDPYDQEFFTENKGTGSWNADGLGILKISGDAPRMYVVDPNSVESWHNVEITVYGMRMSDSNVTWGGLMAYARTNHLVDTNYCDTRGYGGRFKYDGIIDFEKEIKHNSSYAQTESNNYWPEGMPAYRWIGYKFVVYDVVGNNSLNTGVKLELWLDTTDGLNGGNWTKVYEFIDNGENFGTVGNNGGVSCASGINSSLGLFSSDNRPGSETGKPNLAVYFRSDGVNNEGLWYKKASIREILPR
jgi:hypothetical protein